jgi:glycosyltransferase involved in cell wall biosynthesis
MNPTVSVIAPLYNKAKYVADAIKSVLNQSFQDFELIVVDDASTDDSMSIVDQFVDERIVKFHNKENRGVSFTLNRGVEEAKGQLIALIGADDAYFQTKLQKQVALLEKFPEDVIYTDCQRITVDGRLMDKEPLPMEEGFVFPGLLSGTFRIRAYATMMFSKHDFYKAGRFDETLTYSEDWDLALRLSAIRHFRPVKEALYLYRADPKSLTRGTDVSDRSRYRQNLRVISSNYRRNKGILNQREAYLARMQMARHAIMSRSSKYLIRASMSDPRMIVAFARCFFPSAN